MKLKFQLLALFLFTFFFSFLSVKSALAANFNLSGSVKNNSATPIVGATVSVNDANNDSTTTDSSGNYSLSVPQGTYNVQVTPPSGSGFSSAVAVNENISNDTTLNFVLVPTGTVTLSGRVLDRANQPVANQTVALSPNGSSFTNSVTDANGNYSFSVSPGTYTIKISGTNPLSTNASAPATYSIATASISLSQSMIMDIPLPAKQVVVHVQNSSGVAQSNVTLSTNSPNISGLPIGIVTANGGSSSYSSAVGLKTDASGNATMWLFPTASGGALYIITGTPQTGSGYVTTSSPATAITSDTNLTLTLQTPVTLSGRVLDRANNPLSNQTVGISSNGSTFTNSVTDSNGNYSFSVAPGNYFMQVSGTNPLTANAPANYSITSTTTLSLTQNTTMDIPLQAKQVVVHVQDAFGNSLQNATISTNNPLVTAPIGTITSGNQARSSYSSSLGLKTDASGNATLWLFPSISGGAQYFVTATPQSGSGFQSSTSSGFYVTTDTSINLTLQKPVTLSGHVLDRANHPVANQTVGLAPQGTTNFTNSVTDANGNYSFSVNAGNYIIQIAGSNSLTVNAPPSYSIGTAALALSQNTTMDIPIPSKQVVIHVQDVNGVAVPNVTLSTNAPNVAGLLIGTATANGGSSSYSTSVGLKTDSSGNATMWLFPTLSGALYNITATPPSGSIYSSFTLSNISVTGDQTELISLQYNHARPVTTATLSPAADNQGNYSDPTTVTLSATAASGFTIANTYYTLDGGSQQTYSSPFTISGNGNHTITYWSVDNSGVPEAVNTKTFTILTTYSLSGTVFNDVNQNGFQDSGETGVGGVTISLTSGQFSTSTTTDANGNYTFSGLVPGTYTETLTIPNGDVATTTNPTTISLSSNTTQNFGVAQSGPTLVTAINAGDSTQGSYVADTDYTNGSPYTSSATVDTSGIDNPAPQAVYQSVRYGNAFSYTIPGLTPGGTYTVRLHFNELYWGTALSGNSGGLGSRVFNVAINGNQVLSNYDIYAKAGGANIATTEQFPATPDSNGNVTINFTTVTDNAMVNGIEVYSGTLPPPTPTPTPTPATSVIINTGGGTVGNFKQDNSYSGGTTYTSSAAVDTSNVTNPAPQAVYQSVRVGNAFAYNIQHLIPNTNFLVRLHFNELYWTSAGQRVFNVAINGNQVLSNFDIFQAAGGANKALVEDFIEPSDSTGKINITFTSVTDNAMVSGIEIVQPSIPQRTYYTANDGTNFIRSASSFVSGVATQAVNSDGSITESVNNATGYADSGFVLYEGTLGNLPNFTTIGTGNGYGLNLWFDTNIDNEYFAWDSNNILTGLNGDTYALSNGSQNGLLNVNGGTSFFLMSNGQSYSLADLKAGVAPGITANTKVAVWIGVNTTNGSTSSTIQSVNGL